MQRPPRTRRGIPTRTAADWEEAALDVIAQSGVGAVSIPNLARTLGVTKGSFYWHFSSLDDLLSRAVKRWETADMETLDQIEHVESAAERIRALFVEATTAPRAPALYLALALSPDRRFIAALQRMSERRLLVLAGLYRQLGMTEKDARCQALLAYSAYIGGAHLRKTDLRWLRKPVEVSQYFDYAGRVLVALEPIPSRDRK